MPGPRLSYATDCEEWLSQMYDSYELKLCFLRIYGKHFIPVLNRSPSIILRCTRLTLIKVHKVLTLAKLVFRKHR